MPHRLRFAATFALLLPLVGCGAGAGGGPGRDVVRIGYQKGGTLNLVRIREGLRAEPGGAGLRVEWVGFPAGPQLLEALNAGAIDFGHTGDAPPVLAQAAGVPFVYVGYEPARPHSEAMLVPSASPIRTVADLKGKRVALNKGSNVHYLLVRALERAGVRYDEIRPVFLPPADARAAFAGGSVDAWATWDPYFAEAESADGARVLADGEGIVANREFQLASRSLYDTRPQVVAAILDAVAREGEWAQAHPDEVARLLAAEIGIDLRTVTRMVARKSFGLSPMDGGAVAEQQALADAFLAVGLIPSRFAVRDLVPASPWAGTQK